MAIEWRRSAPGSDNSSKDKTVKVESGKGVDARIAAIREDAAARRAAINAKYEERDKHLRDAGKAVQDGNDARFDAMAAADSAETQARLDEANKRLKESLDKSKNSFLKL